MMMIHSDDDDDEEDDDDADDDDDEDDDDDDDADDDDCWGWSPGCLLMEPTFDCYLINDDAENSRQTASVSGFLCGRWC